MTIHHQYLIFDLLSSSPNSIVTLHPSGTVSQSPDMLTAITNLPATFNTAYPPEDWPYHWTPFRFINRFLTLTIVIGPYRFFTTHLMMHLAPL